MLKNLVIVESPAKAKTIGKYLGKDYGVRSCGGHICDLPEMKTGIVAGIKNGNEPTFEIIADKKELVAKLKNEASASVHVWLATDEDREGEAIAWHLKVVLGLDDEKHSRITFTEITKPAILQAMKKPRKINDDLVNAWKARRVLDYLVGYDVSQLLWKKVQKGLSAGRVQSPALRMVADREKEIDDFKSKSSFQIEAELDTSAGESFKAKLSRNLNDENGARKFLDTCRGATFAVDTMETKPAKKSPPPPFTTSTLQLAASQKLGFPVRRTMTVAQKLYEEGMITYMRTDSVNLSDTALESTEAFITASYGGRYSERRSFQTQSQGAQEAHEAIRPTDITRKGVEDPSMKSLYGLIWKRTVASQMADAQLEKTTVRIGLSTTGENLVARGEMLIFDGFLKVYQVSTDDSQDTTPAGLLPAMKKSESLSVQHVTARESFTRPPPRYTEAVLVKRLEEKGIGRPSTYAPTISTIQDRGYVTREDRPGYEREVRVLTLIGRQISGVTDVENTGAEKAKLFPAEIGEIVNEFLQKHVLQIIDYGFTASIEQEFDDISQGQLKWRDMIDKFYRPFQGVINQAQKAEKLKIRLGTDPLGGEPVYACFGRFGPMVQIGDGKTTTPRFRSLLAGQGIKNISLEEAMELFKLPRELGVHNGEQLTAGRNARGPFIRCEPNDFAGIDEAIDDPLEITLERAIELVRAARKKKQENMIKTFPENPSVLILKGRYGPYITVDGKNTKIPKDMDPKSLTLEQCLDLASQPKPGTASADDNVDDPPKVTPDPPIETVSEPRKEYEKKAVLWRRRDLATLRSFASEPDYTDLRLPDDTHTKVERWTVRFPPAKPDRLPGDALEKSYTVKPLTEPFDHSLFGELAILRCLERDGWAGVWVDTYHGGELFWRDMPHESSPVDLSEEPDALELYRGLVAEHRGRRGGFFDVMAWRDSEFLFIEYKGKGARPHKKESSWIAAALRYGIRESQLLFAEHASAGDRLR